MHPSYPRLGSPADRFTRSASRLPDPPILDQAGLPAVIPGQQALALAAAGYRESYPSSHTTKDTA